VGAAVKYFRFSAHEVQKSVANLYDFPPSKGQQLVLIVVKLVLERRGRFRRLMASGYSMATNCGRECAAGLVQGTRRDRLPAYPAIFVSINVLSGASQSRNTS
jgi:hypothetical protein